MTFEESIQLIAVNKNEGSYENGYDLVMQLPVHSSWNLFNCISLIL